jgi:hypothetical protein
MPTTGPKVGQTSIHRTLCTSVVYKVVLNSILEHSWRDERELSPLLNLSVVG